MNLESKVVQTSKSPEELYLFLTDVKNFEQLMPENISKFKMLEEDKFLFALKGMPEIVLKLKESTPHSIVRLGSASDKLNFTLNCDIKPAATGSEAKLLFDGDFNAMMAMMIKGPISKFIEQLATGIEKL